LKHRSKLPRAWREFCADLRDEDGIDPRISKRKNQIRPTGPDRRLGPLCRAVARTLHLALAGSADPLLRDLGVIAVEPAPDAHRLRIIVGPIAPGVTIEPALALAALAERSGYFRAQIAQAVIRRRVPELTFTVAPLPPDAPPPPPPPPDAPPPPDLAALPPRRCGHD
jgi:ribosome-binding factor A